jgi:EAL and modified HD-GYP domain-containing signal transduction protein
MTKHALAERNRAAVPPELSGGLRYVARQPIMDSRGRVHGYELLFRAGADAEFRGDGDLATRTMLDNSVIFGMEKLTGGLPAFVNCTRESLTDDLVQVLQPGATVLEILEDLEPTAELVAACVRLKSAGFRLALDDFKWKPEFAPLVELADYIKVDFIQSNAAERKVLMKTFGGLSVAWVAEKVETQEEYKRAREEGFTLFQGYYFCRPMLMENRKVPANRHLQFEILQLLRSDELDILKLAQLVKQDASLTYRLLRMVNSPNYGLRQEVTSIESALVTVGEDAFRRMATLAITSDLNGNQPVEILRMAFVRGRFCELVAALNRMDWKEQYFLGLLSLMPTMLRVPMAELTPSLPLRRKIQLALEGADSPERASLTWMEFYENGDWAACDRVVRSYGLDQYQLMHCATEAMLWAEDALKFAG